MSTTTTRPPRASKQPAAPFSTAAAKLIEQIQAEARAALLAELSAKDSITVLHGFDADTKRISFRDDHLSISDAKGNRVSLYRRREEPESWRNTYELQGYWHPAKWYGRKTLVDGNGTQWTTEFTPMVQDDFGNLVQVAE